MAYSPNTIVASIAALIAASSATLPASPVYVLGYHTPGDGGEGFFSIGTSATANGGTIINDSSSRSWYRLTNQPLNIRWFGAQPNGSDCTAAFNNALSALPPMGGPITFGSGTWTFSSAISYTYPSGEFSVSIIGAGQGATVLLWPATSGLTLNANGGNQTFHIRDLTIRSTNTSSTTIVGLRLNNILSGQSAASDITRVSFDGGSGVAGWGGIAVDVIGWNNVNYDSLLVFGFAASTIGLSLNGNPALAFPYSIIHNLWGCSFNGCVVGLAYNNQVQGVTVDGCNFVNGGTGIQVSGAAGLSQLQVVNSEFSGIANDNIAILGTIGQVQICNNLFIVETNAAGVAVVSTGNLNFATITGNLFLASTTTTTFGVISAAGLPFTVATITGNVFNGFDVAVTLGTGSANVNVQSNKYTNCTTTITNNGTNNTLGGGST